MSNNTSSIRHRISLSKQASPSAGDIRTFEKARCRRAREVRAESLLLGVCESRNQARTIQRSGTTAFIRPSHKDEIIPFIKNMITMPISPTITGLAGPWRRRPAVLLVIALALLGTSSNLLVSAEQGQTRISRYETNTVIKSRLATTKITVEFSNERDCATIRGFTMQLPLNARVSGLTVDTSNQCRMTGEVKTVLDAQEEFHSQSSAGKAAALLQAWDATSYPVWVSLPPLGTTTVEIVYEELLARANYMIPFQIPLSPGLPVDMLIMDVTVSELDSGVTSFDVESLATSRAAMEITKQGTVSATAHLELSDVAEDELPRLIRASYDYDPAIMPRGGLVIGSGACVSHLFNPSALLETALPKNIVFVIDVSGSMSGQKLDDAKAAFQAIIQTLEDDDYFTIHTFSSEGTKAKWGPSKATSFAKSDASTFVKSLSADGGTNLYGAFLDGLAKAKTIQDMAIRDEEKYQFVPVLMMLSDGQATEGDTNPNNIARAVKSANEDINAKIFALAFGEGADLPLLLGIAIQNQGRAIPIYEGYGDSAEQMENFYSAELRRVLLSDLTIDLASDIPIESQTQTAFPVFADGSEVFVRAKPRSEEYFQGSLQVIANAISSTGPKQWIFEGYVDDNDSQDTLVMPYKKRECVQSFAHQKIASLLNFREATASLGSELDEYADLILGVSTDNTATGRASNLADDIEAYALELALDAGLVWPGLTAMVTVENEACAEIFAEGNEICSDGDGNGDVGWGDMDMEEEGESADVAYTASAPSKGFAQPTKSRDKSASMQASAPPQAPQSPPQTMDASASAQPAAFPQDPQVSMGGIGSPDRDNDAYADEAEGNVMSTGTATMAGSPAAALSTSVTLLYTTMLSLGAIMLMWI